MYDPPVFRFAVFLTIRQIKVEPALFYYACDKLGLLLFQDMPSLRTSVTNPNDKCQSVPILDPAVQEEFNRQLAVHIEQHKNYPSIVAWVRLPSRTLFVVLT